MADQLAVFFESFVMRSDAWGGYMPLRLRERFGKVYTAPRRAQRGKVQLSRADLQRHFEGEDEGHLVGLHPISRDNTSLWFGIDLDAHGADAKTEFLLRLLDALRFCVEWLGERFSLLVEDSGAGFHLWGYLNQAVPTPALFLLLHDLANKCELATGIRPELYPKQPRLSGGFGNWLRLPGRHHTLPRWSRICLPSELWLVGAAAADLILHRWPASPASAVPHEGAWPELSVPDIDASRVVRSLEDAPADRSRVILAYLAKLPNGVAGSARSDRLFSLARFLRHGMLCSDSEAIPIMRAWDGCNTPPLGEAKIASTWRNSGLYASAPFELQTRERHHTHGR